jgi:hypothetical protein
MSTLRPFLPAGRALAVLDAALVAWVILWAVLGLAIAHEVRGLRQLSGSVTRVGVAIEQTGRTLQTLGKLPLVGDQAGTAARDIDAAGRSTVQSGRQSRRSIHNLSWMLGLVLGVIPTVPLLVLYLPLRLAAYRERRALRRLVADRRDDPVLRRLLAQRALLTMPYQRLVVDGEDPLEQARGARLEELADAELARLGLDGSRR